MNAVARVFANGRSQAVRLPKRYRFTCKEVFVTREKDRVILTPKLEMTWEKFFALPKCPDFALERTDNAPVSFAGCFDGETA